ncbi:regulatory protein, luxR family [Lentzea albidocapillata subsp. violacea]|uniref:Regulatory protein, luxR family n=1 Tax=Lentzea albidocapillata subsp. violacea TaxID=128104 RepID=A0A1G9V927_9PSEU|nr:LuxR C-terminal-related transcriptional regulator [Lentzea albidocapillata]SDM68577.1 regulatory protein, luxR family [Lentzea albidocapillata subsp. violacea]
MSSALATVDSGIEPVRVAVESRDLISAAGVTHLLKNSPRVRVVQDRSDAHVLLALVNELCAQQAARLRACGSPKIVVIAARVHDLTPSIAAQAGLSVPLRRADVNPERLIKLLLGGHAVQDRSPVLNDRDLQLLKLLADGATIAEVAAQLFCSERTVKYALHQLLERFGLRNRVHAVAWALRSGLL